MNVLYSNKKGQKKNIYMVCTSERNMKCINQVNLLMILDGEERHCFTIKNISRLLSKLYGKTKHTYQCCIYCLNNFRTTSARDKHYEYCSSNGHVKVNMPTEKEKMIRI